MNTTSSRSPGRSARRLNVTGLVQGVGFRPFVHRLALRHALGGWVLNANDQVEIHVEGDAGAIERFIGALCSEAPVLARVEDVALVDVPPLGVDDFIVRTSDTGRGGRVPVSPDVAMCDHCARELVDPRNRRFRYPFITCTDCGPRFTVIESMPYDRERTSMRAFAQCAECLREYSTPDDRRYHSETNSCPACGPQLWLEAPGSERRIRGVDAIDAAAAHLLTGGVLAIRGLGGFHLAVDATSHHAVARLRERKHREAKPLAVMVASLRDAHAITLMNDAEAATLVSPARPIVLLHPAVHPTVALAENIASGLDRIGVMLAYTPLHHLLLEAVGRPLVMTSGNSSDEPIAIGNAEAVMRLRDIADAFLLHDREIVARYDDSVVRVVDGAPIFLRRSRGHAPDPIDLPVASPQPLLAVGPHLKNTLTLVHERRAYPSQHIGDLENLETIEHFRAVRERMQALFDVRPEVVVHDLHPGYLSTRIARETGMPRIAVQHHHAHVAAVLAEHGRCGPAIGVAYDGTGYGDDGNVWGAEVLLADLTGYRRLAHLRYAPLPGGDVAARAPWRVALGYSTLAPHAAPAFALAVRTIEARERMIVERQLERRLHSPLASSMGRLFDAAAAVIGVRCRAQYEGQAAMELESLAASHTAEVLPYEIARTSAGWELDPVPLLVALGERARSGATRESLAAAFHETVARATVDLVERTVSDTGCGTIVLGGGCFQNHRLLSTLARALRALGLEVLVPRRLSPNDGAVGVGQAAIGAALLANTARMAAGVTTTITRNGG